MSYAYATSSTFLRTSRRAQCEHPVHSTGTCVQYSGKLLTEKTFTNFTVLWLFAKDFSAKFGGVASFGVAKASNLQKFFSVKICIFQRFTKVFSLKTLPPYGMSVTVCTSEVVLTD